MNKRVWIGLWLLGELVATSCGTGDGDVDSDTDANGDGETDADADSDVEPAEIGRASCRESVSSPV